MDRAEAVIRFKEMDERRRNAFGQGFRPFSFIDYELRPLFGRKIPLEPQGVATKGNAPDRKRAFTDLLFFLLAFRVFRFVVRFVRLSGKEKARADDLLPACLL